MSATYSREQARKIKDELEASRLVVVEELERMIGTMPDVDRSLAAPAHKSVGNLYRALVATAEIRSGGLDDDPGDTIDLPPQGWSEP